MQITSATTSSPVSAQEVTQAYQDARQAKAAPDIQPAQTPDAEPSQAKSFAYGFLDLDKPSDSESSTSAYTAGKWTGAAAKVGALITLLA